MARRITPAALILLAACQGGPIVAGGRSRALSYAQYHSLKKGLSAQGIVKAFGAPLRSLKKDRKVRGLKYACENAGGDAVELSLVFDASERLVGWSLRGAQTA